MRELLKPGTLLKAKEEWPNWNLFFHLKIDDIILVVNVRPHPKLRDAHIDFDAVVPDGRLKGFYLISWPEFAKHFEIVYHGTTTAETRNSA